MLLSGLVDSLNFRRRAGNSPKIPPHFLHAFEILDAENAPVHLAELDDVRHIPYFGGFSRFLDLHGDSDGSKLPCKGKRSPIVQSRLNGLKIIFCNKVYFAHGISFSSGWVLRCSSAHKRFQQAALKWSSSACPAMYFARCRAPESSRL